MDQKFLQNYDSAELKTASEFLSNWLPFLSRGLCNSCSTLLSDRIRSMPTLTTDNSILIGSTPVIIDRNNQTHVGSNWSNDDNGDDTHSLGSWKDESEVLSCEHAVEEKTPTESVTQPKKSWADMAYEDELAEEQESEDGALLDEEERKPKVVLSREQRECIRFRSVERKKDFAHLEKVRGRIVNIVDGLELHKGVFSAAEQKRIVEYVEQLQEMGRNGQLKERTYSAPAKWMRGKGRVTLQFGCCYNYAIDKKGNPPGIMKNELVDPLPHLFKVMIKRLVRWHVLPPSSVPDSCIVNIYDEGDCIPPHIDNHDFLRPFCTVSFLSVCEIIFGSNLKITGPGEFAGSFAVPLPVGSVLVLNGNGADVAKHCVPAVPNKRISITFRKMDKSKWPEGYVPEPDLQVIQPLLDEADIQKNNNSYSGARRSSPRTLNIGSSPRMLNVGSSPGTPNSIGSSPGTPNSIGRGDRSKELGQRQHSDNHNRYSDNRVSESRHSDNRYPDDRHSDNRLSDDRHSDNRYSDDRYSNNRYYSAGRGRRQVSINSNGYDRHSDNRLSDDRHSHNRLSDDRHSDNRLSDDRHSDNRHTDDRNSDGRYYSAGRGRRQVSVNSNGRFQVNLLNR